MEILDNLGKTVLIILHESSQKGVSNISILYKGADCTLPACRVIPSISQINEVHNRFSRHEKAKLWKMILNSNDPL